MVILGIDPGTADTGFGVLELKGKKIRWLDYGSIRTKAGEPMQNRLAQLYANMGKIFTQYRPEMVVIEKLFFNTNVKTAISVGQARGVVMLLCSQHRAQVTEYTALQAKLVVAGYGRANKKRMQERVGEILKIKEKITPDDAADGLAMALCYLSKNKLADFPVPPKE